MRWAPRRFNDTLALVLVILTFALWGYVLVNRLPLDSAGVIIGSTINTLGVIAVFYYRKRPDEPTPPAAP